MASTNAEERPTQIAATREGLRFEAPEMGEVVLSFDANASLSIPTVGGSEFATPLYGSSRDPLVIRFAAPEKAAAPAVRPTPIARTTDEVAQPQVRATLASTSSLETVSPWRYADEMPPAPALVSPAHTVVASTVAQAAEPAAQPDGHAVRVQRGDSLWLLALRHLGDGHAWPQIASANPQITDPNRIAAGELVLIPAAVNKIAEVAAPAAKPVMAAEGSKSVIVRQGDSLWKLAEFSLGNGAAWNCIAAANPQITDADRIFAGQTLVLPSDCNSHS
jgi:LysM repeat protein